MLRGSGHPERRAAPTGEHPVASTSRARYAQGQPKLDHIPCLLARWILQRSACPALQLSEPLDIRGQARQELFGKIQALVLGQRESILE